MLLIFWIVLFTAILGDFAAHFGAASLFLSPEYMGVIGHPGFFILGAATAVFSMSWHITTFIIHSKRLPFLGATRHSFLKYCFNNAVIPLLYLLIFGWLAARFLITNENRTTVQAVILIGSFYLGYIVALLLSFLYFFSVDRNILKTALSKLANPKLIKGLIPYDSLDREVELIRAGSFLDRPFKIQKIKRPYSYNQRFVNTVLRRHHRNAVFAIIVSVLILLVLGVFINQPFFRIPAAAGFLLLFAVLMAGLGAFKYFLRSWEVIGWIVLVGVLYLLVQVGIIDMRSLAYGMQYESREKPTYTYDRLEEVFNEDRYLQDKKTEQSRLENWAVRRDAVGRKPPVVIISASGGGSRSAYWTFRCLQYADSLSGGALFQQAVLISGASGGMIGAAYWRSVQLEALQEKGGNPYSPEYQDNIGKDLLNAVIFSLACVDLISPFNKITVAGRRYHADRGYAFDNELAANTAGLLDKELSYFREAEARGISPLVVINSTIINDGRKLLISPQPVGYLTSASRNGLHRPVIDAVDFGLFFKGQDPYNMKLTSALRMSATFPIILPVVKLPSVPEMNIMDAGLRDNFGLETGIRYLHTFEEWLKENAGPVILLQIRDTREIQPSSFEEKPSLFSLMLDPVFSIQQKWSAFQTFAQTYLQQDLADQFRPGQYHKVLLEYRPAEEGKSAALNFHLTEKEKQDLLRSVFNPSNQEAFLELRRLLSHDTIASKTSEASPAR